MVNNNLVVRDLGSMNGVWVNGDRVEQQAAVGFGDELMIGDDRFRLEADKPVSSKPKPDKAPAPVVPAKPYADARPPANKALVTPPKSEISGEFPVPIDDEDERFTVPPPPDKAFGMDTDGDDFIPLKKP